jgi:hypothetical protein|tara:strand:- start:1753 stop:2166 length:414 start_codon:yes stop_codon:yes gene_type:complete
MLPFLGFLSNPITKLVADKVIGAATHAMEKKKIIRQAEIEATANIDYAKIEAQKAVHKAEQAVLKQQVKSGEKSWKDEYLTVVFTILLCCHFVPQLQPSMMAGWEMLSTAPSEFWYIIMTIVAGSFGVSTLTKWKGK